LIFIIVVPVLYHIEPIESYKRHIKQRWVSKEDKRRKKFDGNALNVPPVKRESDQKEIKIEDILKDMEDGKDFVLVGKAGMGKTRFVKKLQYQMINGNNNQLLPIYFTWKEIRNFLTENALKEKIRDSICEEISEDCEIVKTLVKESIDDLFKNKRLIFLLDNLDGIKDKDNLLTLLDEVLNSHRIILACRPYIYKSLQKDLSHYVHLTVAPFYIEDAMKFLSKVIAHAEKFLGKEAYSQFNNLLQDPSLRTTKPLKIINKQCKEACKKKAGLDAIRQVMNRTRIYEEWIHSLLSSQENIHTKHFCPLGEIVLPKLSYKLLDKGHEDRFPWSTVYSLLSDLKITWEEIDGYIKVGLFSEVEEDLVFSQSSFQKYFASLELKKQLIYEGNVNKKVLIDHLEYNKWGDVIPFLIASLETKFAHKTITTISDYDLFFAGRCIAYYNGDKDEDFNEIINDLFKKIELPDAQEALAKIGTDGIITRLLGLYNKGPHKKAAAYVLSMIHSESPIVPSLKGKEGYVRQAAAEALDMICSERAAKQLLPLLKDKDGYVRWKAAEALGMIGSENAIEQLTPLFKDENRYVHGAAVKALDKISMKLKEEDLSKLAESLHKEGYREAVNEIKRVQKRRFIK
jgi:hypothetical protein